VLHELAITLGESPAVAMLQLSELNVIEASVVAFRSGGDVEAERATGSSTEFRGKGEKGYQRAVCRHYFILLRRPVEW
jgi:hypothetical protein